MKIKFKKFAATSTFIKLFGVDRHKSGPHLSAPGETDDTGETDDAYEYYYKRGNTYYFRNSEGNKFSINYDEPQKEFIKGNKYKMDTINNPQQP